MVSTMREMTCEMCRKAMPISDIKYMPKGDSKVALCSKCRAKVKSKTEKKESASDLPGKKAYFCVRCRYKFKYRPGTHTLLRCPYCGKSDKIIEDIAPDADKLLRDVDLE
jgi:DNA-directed RNA polymerase subunit RPC12/RpoP